MSFFYLDSSALAKRYLLEAGTLWVRSVVDPAASNVIIVAEITRVEVAAALAARHRATGGTTRRERDDAIELLLQHCDVEYQIIAVDLNVVSRAVTLTQAHRLRGYDAVQLAAALTAAAILPGLVFIAADDDLLAAARAEGLATENPNQH
ncbi:MAG: type II toxin-antitoxin system VapC family toxin [Roseiflexaceae bacterium]|nr:type II toxin-antitoxin system VapC family toxin [Roseiflexaceae bacterium]